MDLFFHRFPDRSFGRKPLQYLAFCWISGLVLGALCYCSIQESVNPFSADSLFVPASAPGSVFAAVFPLVFSWFAFHHCCNLLMFPIVFLFAFIQAFCSMGFLFIFGSAGWLICLLYFFSSIVTTPIYWLCWTSFLDTEHHSRFFSFPAMLLVCGLVGYYDYSRISPFLLKILF